MKVREFLDERHVPYEFLSHAPTYDAQHMAHAVHVKGRAVAKCVLLRTNHGYRYLGHCELRLASESEVSEVCPDCKPGVLLPFGSQYGVTTLVDSSLEKEDEIVFEGSTPEESIRMKFTDFCRLESPLIVPLNQADVAGGITDGRRSRARGNRSLVRQARGVPASPQSRRAH